MFVARWEYEVKRGCEKDFEKVYGPEGEWVLFFRRSAEYMGTRLVKDVASSRRFFTVDYWSSEAAYLKFREENAEEYARIDARCEMLTVRERKMGSCEVGERENQ